MSSATLGGLPAGSTILVTGGAGYLGSVITGYLLSRGFRVRIIDNLSYGGQGLLSLLNQPDFEFQRGDIRRARDIDQALTGVDAVVHLAAVVGEKACDRDPTLARETNGDGSELLYERALAHRVRRFVFASTCSNYGATATGGAPVDEATPLKPLSLYAELKVDFENYLLSRGDDGLVTTCLRFATAYGLSGRPRFDLTVNEFTRDLLLGRQLRVYGEHFWRPYCHTTDVARACGAVLGADSSLLASQTFNVGATDENYQKKTLIEMILKQVPQAHGLVTYVRRDQDPRDYRVNCDRIRDRLGYSPAKRVRDGIEEIIAAITDGVIENPDDPHYRNA